jgi:hypothetical protein
VAVILTENKPEVNKLRYALTLLRNKLECLPLFCNQNPLSKPDSGSDQQSGVAAEGPGLTAAPVFLSGSTFGVSIARAFKINPALDVKVFYRANTLHGLIEGEFPVQRDEAGRLYLDASAKPPLRVYLDGNWGNVRILATENQKVQDVISGAELAEVTTSARAPFDLEFLDDLPKPLTLSEKAIRDFFTRALWEYDPEIDGLSPAAISIRIGRMNHSAGQGWEERILGEIPFVGGYYRGSWIQVDTANEKLLAEIATVMIDKSKSMAGTRKFPKAFGKPIRLSVGVDSASKGDVSLFVEMKFSRN